ncbi:ABC transporter ATP-binding protein [Canibacter sp. lx-72]|uniref:ABC transporter ATP-binding protein n=1 Tax=Canibacter zhuwentaonis TaxID=2837491 RepID=UPI001BDC72AA|nr:ABC transporter ATP-binding protein [Canibacter zhuwentaonis]MBT1018696.1 ABC transporter ATP-binding protein [Canibacter zhuwentaonis]
MPPPNKKMIASITDAVKTYNGINVVNGVTFELLAGNTTVLVGPNGSGKTTTIEMLTGLRSMTGGKAVIAGIPVKPSGEHRFHTGVQLQSSGLPSKIKTKEVIRSIECLYSNPADWKTLAAELGVDTYLNSTVDNLSGGQRRRLDILCAAMGRPSLLVLDEPTSGIDPEGRALVWDFVRSLSSKGCAVLTSTHDMAEAEAFADELLVMAQGKIQLRGSVANVLASLGGDRRIRVLSPSSTAVEIVKNSGLRFAHTGSSIVLIGSADQTARVTAQLDEKDPAADVLSGPVRLEDVFSIITEPTTEQGGENVSAS